MKIVVLTGSPHLNGTSNTLVSEFIRGAKENNHEIERFDLPFLKIHPCIGCGHCNGEGPCVFQDDMPHILDTILEADMIVFGSGLYFFGFTAQLKAAIDRFYSRKELIRKKQLKSVFFVTCGNPNDRTMNAVSEHIQVLIEYLNLENKGTMLAVGYGAVHTEPEEKFKTAAYQFGQSIR